ncbi:MAG TPA: dihydrofolate reductase [Hyphomicrobiaceae bacterium]|nr:dihydrofolate reductase [Hyphomicrobiaceae bacterium]
MLGQFCIEGYAIVSVDGMIADGSRRMVDELKVEADSRYFLRGLDQAVLVVHGRHSQEDDAKAAHRRRLILTQAVADLGKHPTLPNALFWNPAGIPFLEACGKCGLIQGRVAVTGGTNVFGLFLELGFDAFHLSRSARIRLPGGRPIFPQVPTQTPEDVLKGHGLIPGPVEVLDAPAGVSLVTWARQP